MPQMNDPEDQAPRIHLAGTVPAGADNGLTTICADMLKDARRRRLAVVELVCMRTITDHPEDGPSTPSPVVRIVTVEPILDADDQDVVRRARDRARTGRVGQPTLDQDDDAPGWGEAMVKAEEEGFLAPADGEPPAGADEDDSRPAVVTPFQRAHP